MIFLVFYVLFILLFVYLLYVKYLCLSSIKIKVNQTEESMV